MKCLTSQIEEHLCGHKHSFPSKTRYYTQQKVFKDYVCNPDASWSAAHCRKNEDFVGKSAVQALTEKVKEVENRLSSIEETLNKVLHILLASLPS